MIVWLLDLDLGGTAFRFATQAASVTEGSATLVYRAGLTAPTVDFGADGPSGRSVALELHATPDGYSAWVDVPHIRQMLEAGTATLRRWKTGTDRRQARVMASGSLASPSVARGNKPLVLSLESPPWEDGTRIIAPSHMVSTDTYPTPSAKTGSSCEVDPQVYGAYPPVVIGYPGDRTSLGSARTTPTETAVQGPPSGLAFTRTSAWAELGEGSPALKVELNVGVWQWWDRSAIACHPVAATHVIIWDQSDQRWDLFPVSYQLNGLGQTFAYVDYTAASKIWLRTVPNHELWCVWIPEYGGGLRSDRGGTMEGLGEVLGWMLAKMRSPTALASQRGERPALDEFKLACYVNTDITVWEWVSQEVLEVFPVVWVETDEGGYLRHWNLTPGAPPVARLDTSTQPIEVASDLLCDTGDIANFLTLRYAYGPDGVHKSITLAAEDGPSGSNQHRHPACQRSEAQHGRIAKTWESRIVKDGATARRLLNHLARKHANGAWSFILQDARSRVLDFLDIGDRVVVTASEIGVSAEECIVLAVVFEGQECRVMMQIVEED